MNQENTFVGLTDMFLERLKLYDLLDKKEGVDIIAYEGIVNKIEELDNTISTIREIERPDHRWAHEVGVEEYKVIVEETTSYTIYVKATSRTEAEEQVQQIIDDNQYWERGIAEAQGVHIYSIEEV
jgi:hypothetical protein